MKEPGSLGAKNEMAPGIQVAELDRQACQLATATMIQLPQFSCPRISVSGAKVPESEPDLSSIGSYTKALAGGQLDQTVP